jgi:DNA topoisomerase IA
MSKTPLTDHYTKRLRNFCGDEFVPIEFARKLERELAAVTEQRDRLAEVLNDLWHNYSLTGAAYELIEKALAAVKGEHQ